MSKSQKHSGKVLVPWFNIAEWKAVYHLINAPSEQNLAKALQILQIWKKRTPLLSAGVEGTLITLEALQVNSNHLSSHEVTHVFATSLVRFLNLCAANSDKQGTFYEAAMKSGLPDWLIRLRHDIAHSHNVPSESMLRLSLEYCLDWLKKKYWDVQEDFMYDFVANAEWVIEDIIYAYLHIKQLEPNIRKGRNKRLRECLKKLIKNGDNISNEEIIQRVLDLLAIHIKKNPAESSTKTCDLILNSYKMFPQIAEDSSHLDSIEIPTDFLQSWNDLLDVLHYTNILPELVKKLFDIVSNCNINSFYRKLSSLWIYEIYKGLNQHTSEQEEQGLSFSTSTNCLQDRKFAATIVENPTPFTHHFLKEVLVYNNAPLEYIADCMTLLEALKIARVTPVDEIHLIEDIEISAEEPLNFEVQKEKDSSKRWTLIEDITPFNNLPLGVLPSQDCTSNPVLP